MEANNKLYTIATLVNTVLLLGCAGYLFFNGAPSSAKETVAVNPILEETEPIQEPPKQISRGSSLPFLGCLNIEQKRHQKSGECSIQKGQRAILERCWDHVGLMFVSFPMYVL